MPRCGCSGQTCGCALKAGSGVQVTGTGTALNPFVIAVDPFSLNLGTAIRATGTSTIEMSKTGTGANGDPIVLQASVVLRSPDNRRWTVSVSNTGALSATAL